MYHVGEKILALPYSAAYHEDITALVLSDMIGPVTLSATSSQKSSRSLCGLSFFEPATIAALMAPIDVPATMSNFTPCLDSALYTPHSYAPNEPPPCITKTVSYCSFCTCLIFNSRS